MKEKLKDFTHFSRDLFPHEIAYLSSVAQFEDRENREIFERILHNGDPRADFYPFDLDIDKRKYSRLKKWIQKKLSLIDVDLQYEWIIEMERCIMQDDISPEHERQILKSLSSLPSSYHFVKHYDLIRHFRQYLLIRMRHKDYEKVHTYLQEHANAYEKSQQTYEKIHEASVDITNQYALNNTESQQWEECLKNFLYDEQLDGRNRYLAAVRLNFIYLNYREYDKLRHILDQQDQLFRRGLFYSRRILANYYSNRLLLHSLVGELERAIYNGYLSIRSRNSDYLHYVNNLSSVLLRNGDKKEALHLMKTALPEARCTNNTHTRVAFATFYIRCLNENNALLEGQRYAEIFLRGYKEQVMSQRWHSFFAAYLQNLMGQERYDLIVRVSQKYKLVKREEAYKKRPGYIPNLKWYISMSQYKEGMISEEQLSKILFDSGRRAYLNSDKSRIHLRNLLQEMNPHLPSTMGKLAEKISI